MRTGIKVWIMVLLFAAAIGFSGCGSSKDRNLLENIVWVLTAYGDPQAPQEALSTTMVTAQFDGSSGTVNGTGGCNSYGGDYAVSNGTMTISNLLHTEIYCDNPQEDVFFSLLAGAQSYQVDNEALRIGCADDQVLIFMPQVTYTFTEEDNGSSAVLEKGQYLLLTLSSNPSTGYAWEVNASAVPVLQQIGDSTYVASESGSIGGGGTETFRFKAAQSGSAVLSLIYRQSWEQDFAYRFDLNVTVN